MQLTHYLAQMTHQAPIESQFVKMLTDNLNAEIVLGTVSNVQEVRKLCGRACRWACPDETHFVIVANAVVVARADVRMRQAIEWLSYTYLMLRMKRNPLQYGLSMTDVEDDPQLQTRR